jgi:hypothetical protein
MRFENGKAFELNRCPKCYQESKKVPLKFDKTKTEQQKQKPSSKAKRRDGYVKNETLRDKVCISKKSNSAKNAVQKGRRFSKKSTAKK